MGIGLQLLFFVIVVAAVIIFFYPDIVASGLARVVGLGILLLVIAGWHLLFYQLTLYALDYWIVTNHRVLDSQQQGFFAHTVVEAPVERVEDVTTTLNGLIPTFFNFGDVAVETAGAHEKITFKQVPDPELVRATILDAREALQKRND